MSSAMQTQTMTVKIRLPKEQTEKVADFRTRMNKFLDSVPPNPSFASMTPDDVKKDLETRE
jgi:hypothetical protein